MNLALTLPLSVPAKPREDYVLTSLALCSSIYLLPDLPATLLWTALALTPGSSTAPSCHRRKPKLPRSQASSQAVVWRVPLGQQHGHQLGRAVGGLMCCMHVPSWHVQMPTQVLHSLPPATSPCTPLGCIPSAAVFRRLWYRRCRTRFVAQPWLSLRRTVQRPTLKKDSAESCFRSS